MSSTVPSLQILFEMTRLQATISRKIDSRLGGGLGFSDIMILFHLSQAEGEMMRRIDLAEKIGLTPSGVTRLLAPMEKIGLIRREANARDARVSLVSLAPGGKKLLSERIDSAEELAEELLPANDARSLAAALISIGSSSLR